MGSILPDMHRVWLTLLLAIAMLTSGLSAAVAGPTCPMHVGASGSHDCCDDHGDKGTPSKSMDGCMMGQACRGAPPVMPAVEPIRLSLPVIVVDPPVLQTAAPPRADPNAFWRPPRTV